MSLTIFARRSALVTALAASLLVVIAAPAIAGDVTTTGATITYTAQPGDGEVLDVIQTSPTVITFQDGSLVLTESSADCVQVVVDVMCTGAVAWTGVTVDLGDQNDTLDGGGLDVALTAMGGPGADLINGTPYADMLHTGDDLLEDTLTGGAGNDTLTSGAVAGTTTDTLNGGAGADILTGGAGDDVIDGGADGDVDQLIGDDGNDLLTSSGTAGGFGDTIEAGLGADTLVGSPNEDTLRTGQDSAVDTATGGAGDDTLESQALVAGPGDILDGGAGTDNVYGGEGDDTIRLGVDANEEESYGGGGDDLMLGQSTAGPGIDLLHGDTGNDTIVAGAGADRLFGEAGNDTLTGGTGSTDLLGGTGNDTLNGGTADETIDGEAGDDTLRSGGGSDYLRGGDDSDTIDLTALTVQASLSVEGGAGNDILRGGAIQTSLYGGAGNDIIMGGSGDEALFGGAGADVFNGGAGIDQVSYSDRIAPVLVDLQTAAADGELGENDAIGPDVEAVIGGQGNDTLLGNDLPNLLNGWTGNDVIDGRGGSDGLTGGAGTDTLTASSDNVTDTVACGGGTPDGDVANLDYTDALEIFGGCETVNRTTKPADPVSPTPPVLPFQGGTRGNDALLGSRFADLILGFAGNDSIRGFGGSDDLQGGLGNDKLYGGVGNDELRGGAGRDTIAGEAGNDTLHGDAGNDVLNGGVGNDTLVGGAGADRMDGGPGLDFIIARDGTRDIVTCTKLNLKNRFLRRQRDVIVIDRKDVVRNRPYCGRILVA